MTKMMRKYQKWLMVVFGILLMLAFLGGPAINEVASMQRNRVIGKIDGQPVRAGEWATAVSEISAFTDLARSGLPYFYVGVDERDAHHWLLLTREAQDAGLVAEAANGEQYLEALAPELAMQALQLEMRRDTQFLMQWLQSDEAQRQAVLDQARARIMQTVMNALGSAHMNQRDAGLALAKLRGVHELRNAYFTAPRVSSRMALVEAKQSLDAATGDVLVIPASALADQVPAPTPEELQAHFDRFKTIKPGEGEFGIGYLLPPRVKLEYIKLDRESIENAVTLDPVEVRKAWSQNRAQYPGEFAAERANIEAALQRDKTADVMREAQSAVQREVQKATRRLETSGRFKILPPDWEQSRPNLAAIAPGVVEAVRAATGVTIPTPEVVTLTQDWLTQPELAALPGIGMSMYTQGGLQIPFAQVVFWARELGGTGPIPVQTGIPVADTYLEDMSGNRYLFTLLATRQESAPDSVADIQDKAAQDFRNLAAFEQLKAQAPQLAATAAAEGLTKLVDQFNLRPPAPPADPTSPAPAPPGDPIATGVRITRQTAQGGPALQEESVREAVMAAADKLDPTLPPEQIPAEAATIAAPAPQNLSVVLFRINRLEPLTHEMVQNEETDARIVSQLHVENMRDKTLAAFSLESLLKRHAYYNGEKRIETPEQLENEDEG